MNKLVELEQLVQSCRLLAEFGYAPASGGNASLATSQGVWVTQRGSVLRDLKAEDFVLVNRQGELLSKEGTPSKEVFLHLAVYAKRPHDTAIIHLHPPNSIAACSLVQDGVNPIPAMVPSYLMRVRGTVLIPYYQPGDPKLAENIGEVAASNQVIYMRNHGIVSSGQTVTQAMQALEEVEENCRIYLLAGGAGKAISEEDCQVLRDKYWGEVYNG